MDDESMVMLKIGKEIVEIKFQQYSFKKYLFLIF